MPEVVLIRHAQSTANVEASWQGRGDAVLSGEGRTQASALSSRLGRDAFDLVVTSPLGRAVETGAALSGSPETADDLIEIDLGVWEGMPYDDVATADADLLRRIYGGSDEAFGHSGERLSDVAVRAWAVIDEVAGRIPADGRAAIVTHGGVIDSIVAGFFPTITRRPHRMASNASLTHLVGDPTRWRLARFNDTAHLGRLNEYAVAHLDSGGSVIALIRHGRTRTNLEGRMQGQSCQGLDDVGRLQAAGLAEWYGTMDRVYTSPLGRAMATASVLTESEPIVVDGLMEIGLGDWEGLAWEEVRTRWPDEVRRIFGYGEDLRRGGRGETWAEMTERVTKTLESLETTPGEVTGVVSHGGAIRAFVGTLGGIGPGTALESPDNTSVTHIALTDHGPVLTDYAVAPHLDKVAVGS